MAGLSAVAEEIAAAGQSTLMLVVSSAMAGSILARHGTDEQNERWLRGIAAGTTKLAFAITEPDAGTNSHNIRTELRTRRRRLPAQRPEGLHLRRRGGRRGARRRALPARGRASSASRASCIVDVDARGLLARRDPDALPRRRQAVDALLRGRRASTPTGSSAARRAASGRSSTASTRSASSSPRCRRDGPARAREGRRLRQRARGVGRADRRRTRPCRTRWPRRRSSSSWPS